MPLACRPSLPGQVLRTARKAVFPGQRRRGDPASAGEPPHQLKGFQRVTLNPGVSATMAFPVTARDLARWDTTSNAWLATAGSYQILVGGSSRSLPLVGTLSVPSTITTSVLAPDGTAAATPAAAKAAAAQSAAAANARAVPVPLTGKPAVGASTTITFIWTVS